MSNETITNNTLYAMAQTMSSREDYPTAVALRKLAWAGYTSLEQVDRASDWMLLAIPGVGIGRLTAIRRLVRPDWQPPRPRLFKAAERFLCAARFALRFWSVEDLEAVIQGAVSLPPDGSPIEKRLSLEQFAQASRKVLRHREAEVWVPALRQMAHQRAGQRHRLLETHQIVRSHSAVLAEGHRQPPTPNPVDAPPRPAATALQSDHYAFSLEERRHIVDHYRTARRNGEVENKEAWAYNNYHISRKTLWRYEQEFPEL